jgi:flagella basal body P-ring formation protein FlgA
MIRWIAQGLLLGCALVVADGVAAGQPELLAHARAEVEAQLRARFPQIERVELRPIVWRGQWLEHATLTAVQAEGMRIPKRVATRFRDDARTRERTVWWQVRALRTVATTRAALRPGDAVRPADLAGALVDVAGEDALAPEEILPRQRVRRYLPAGSLIRVSDLEPAPEVLREQRVKVSVVAGAVTIETAGVAQADGRVGQTIAVINPSSSQRYRAQVTGLGEVTVGGRP